MARGRRGRKIRNTTASSTTSVSAGERGEQPVGGLRGVPGERRRQRLRPEVILERGEAAPGRVARDELHDAGEKQEAEHEQPVEPDDDARAAGQEDREESALQQELVPLEVHEYLAGVRVGQVEGEQRDERGAHEDAEHHECAEAPRRARHRRRAWCRSGRARTASAGASRRPSPRRRARRGGSGRAARCRRDRRGRGSARRARRRRRHRWRRARAGTARRRARRTPARVCDPRGRA